MYVYDELNQHKINFPAIVLNKILDLRESNLYIYLAFNPF